MIIELNRNQFQTCLRLLQEGGLAEGRAVIEGTSPGRVFVDNLDQPKTGIVWLYSNDGFIFFGDAENVPFNQALNDFINQTIKPEAKKVGLEWFEALGYHPGWNQTFERVFQHRTIGSWNQRVYLLEEGSFIEPKKEHIPETFQCVKLNRDILSNNKIKNLPQLKEEILEFWPSIHSFLHHGLGYCMIYEHEIVSYCFSGYVAGNVHCMGVETYKPYRGRGFAKHVAAAFIKECLDSNKIPYWDCMETNLASVAVAEKLGFKQQFDYQGYDFSLKEQ
ncbi:GNAT family N-acetyltransferase [Alkalicoccobacillus gibsonii]|uniref:GNAT family N-acetyltransferase n=1 Tax=Alkalicoccobacillus gibsonii TaxID=79881 RepID=UPI003F7C38BB